jgi:hypothetical protein
VNDEYGRLAPNTRATMVCTRGDQWIHVFELTYEYDTEFDTWVSFSSICLLR